MIFSLRPGVCVSYKKIIACDIQVTRVNNLYFTYILRVCHTFVIYEYLKYRVDRG